MRHQLRGRFWLEAALATTGGVLGLLTLVWRDWIEWALRFDPDRHSGTLEAGIATALLVTALVIGFAARREWTAAVAEQ